MMSVKRRDNKGRVLNNGESQEASGLYVYKYQDAFGNRQKLTSWTLTKTDAIPAGKRPKPALREQIKTVRAALDKGIGNDNVTVLELVDRYLGTKTGIRPSTQAMHKTARNLLSAQAFGYYKISQVKTSDAKLFLIKLQKEDGKGYSTIHNVRGVLRQAFKMAYEDDMISKNPFDFELKGVIVNDSVTREAVSRKDEQRFLDFVKNDKHFCKYYDGIFILFNTGMRISEFCGLTLNDIDLKNKEIKIDHQLQRTSSMKYIIESTKTNAGKRVIPMDEGVDDAFRRIIASRKAPKIEPIVDGYSGFLFLDKNGMPMVALHWEKYFEHICEKFNKIYRFQIPKITPHVCRHTYCSNKAGSGMNPKVLQYLMGHSDIGVTMNTYTHLGLSEAKEEMDRLAKDTLGIREEAWKNRKKRA